MTETKGLGLYPIDVQHEQLYDVTELAHLFKVSKSKVEKMKPEELPESISPMGRKLYPASSVNKWLCEKHPELWETINPSKAAFDAVQRAS